MSHAWRIGEAMPRREDRALLRGESGFFHRVVPADAAAMVVVRSPIVAGTLRDVDLSACSEVAGYLGAVLAADLPDDATLPCLDTLPSSKAAFLSPLARDRVRYLGEPVAAILGRDAEAAASAAARVVLHIAPSAGTAGVETPTTAEQLHQDAPDNVVHVLHHRVGDPESAFRDAALVLEETFRFHRISACPLEPRGAAAIPDGNGGLTMWATTQVPAFAGEQIATMLGLPPDAVRYQPIPLGGGFGAKEAFYAEEFLVAVAALRFGFAVAWREDRGEHFVSSAHAREGRAKVRIALDADGIVTALDVDGRSDIGAGYALIGNTPGVTLGAMIRGPYRIPNMRARTASVVTNKTPLNVYRGAGHPQAVFAMERMMDRAAREIGLDRAEIRRRNVIPADAFPLDRGISYPGAGRVVYDSGDYAKCLALGLEAIDADGFAERRAKHEAENLHERLGLGFSVLVELTATGPGEIVNLSVEPDGSIRGTAGYVAIGQGAESTLVQILSDSLGLDADSIKLSPHIKRGSGDTFASRGAAVGGAAAAAAATALKSAVIELAAETLALPADRLSWAEGAVVVNDGRNAPLPLTEIYTRAEAAGLDACSRLSVVGKFDVSAPSYASGCHAAVVAVDIETGAVRVVDYAVAHDCGTVINPRGVEGQMVGGVMQGIGATLFEEIAYDDDANPLVRRLMDYTLPVAANAPRFHFRHVETPSPLNPIGAKGAGEAGFTGAPAAVVNAIEDALAGFGVHLTDDGPYTPARIRRLLRGKTDAARHPVSSPIQ